MISQDRLSQSIFKIGVILIIVFMFIKGLPMLRELRRIGMFKGIKVGLQLKQISKLLEENRKAGAKDPGNLSDFLKEKFPGNYQKMANDPWMRSFILEKNDKTNELMIYSCGIDGKPKTTDDFFILVK